MSRETVSHRIGCYFLLLLGAVGLAAHVDPLIFKLALLDFLRLFGALEIDRQGIELATEIAAAMGHDIAICAVAVTGQIILGFAVGGILGPLAPALVSRLTAVLTVLSPFVLMAFAIAVLLQMRLSPAPETSVIWFVAVLAGVGWPGIARAVSGAVMEQTATPYYRAAREVGLSAPRSLLRHVLPTVGRRVGFAIATVAAQTLGIVVTLAFLGLGPPYGMPSLGSVLADQMAAFSPEAWWRLALPVGTILMLFTCLALNSRAERA